MTAKQAKPKDSEATRPTRTALKRELRNLARDFADGVVELLDRYGMWDQLKPLDGEEHSRVRRSADDLLSVANRILADLRARKQPVAISSIAKGLGMTTRDVAHPINLLVAEGKVLRTGERRGARYAIAPRARAKRATAKRAAAKRKTSKTRSKAAAKSTKRIKKRR